MDCFISTKDFCQKPPDINKNFKDLRHPITS